MERLARIAWTLAAAFLALVSTPSARAQQPPDILHQKAVLELPGMNTVLVDTGIVYSTVAGHALKLDFFRPRPEKGAAKAGRSPRTQAPLVIFVNGVGVDDPPLRRWGIYQSWGRLAAVSGMAAVTYDCRRDAAREDLETLVAHLRRDSGRYGIDPNDIAIWASSANLTEGSRYALNPANTHVKAAVFYYGSIDTTYFRTDLPILVGRAGLDNMATNAGLDNFVWRALRRNATVSSINVPNGRHGFDLFDNEESSREAVRATLAFLRANLSLEVQEGYRSRAAQRLAVDRHAARDWAGALEAAQAWLTQDPAQAQGWMILGDAHYNLRRYREAGENYDRAGNAGYYPAFAFYNAGCSWALAGERERALTSVEKAVATGFVTDRRGMANDPDFASIKDDPRFVKATQTPAASERP
jgi:dienelactone hydrolase